MACSALSTLAAALAARCSAVRARSSSAARSSRLAASFLPASTAAPRAAAASSCAWAAAASSRSCLAVTSASASPSAWPQVGQGAWGSRLAQRSAAAVAASRRLDLLQGGLRLGHGLHQAGGRRRLAFGLGHGPPGDLLAAGRVLEGAQEALALQVGLQRPGQRGQRCCRLGQLGVPGAGGLQLRDQRVGLQGAPLVPLRLAARAGRVGAGQGRELAQLVEFPGGDLGLRGLALRGGLGCPRRIGRRHGGVGGFGCHPGGQAGLGSGRLGGRQVGQLRAGASGRGPGVARLLAHAHQRPLDRAHAQQVEDQPAALGRLHGREGGQLLLLRAHRGQEGALVHAEDPPEVGVGVPHRLRRELAVDVDLDRGREVAALEHAPHLVAVAFVLEHQLHAHVLVDARRAQLRLLRPSIPIQRITDSFDDRALPGAVRAVDADQAVGEFDVGGEVDAVVAQPQGAQVHG